MDSRAKILEKKIKKSSLRAEITMKEKLELSPRRKALDMAIEYLKNYKN